MSAWLRTVTLATITTLAFGLIIPWTYDFLRTGGPSLVWTLAVPCWVKHTCAAGEPR